MTVLILNILAILVFCALFAVGIILAERAGARGDSALPASILIALSALAGFVVCPVLFAGLKVLKPNEALVLTLFGEYYGTLQEAGFYFVNPFAAAVNPTKPANLAAAAAGMVERQLRQAPAPTSRSPPTPPPARPSPSR